VAEKKGPLDSIAKLASKGKLKALVAKLPFVKGKIAPSPEPFSAIEDDTPLGDLLSSENAAPVAPAAKAARASIDIHGVAESLVKNPVALICGLAALVLILAIAIVAIIVSLPPKAVKAEAPFTKEGIAVIKAWLPPPGDPLVPRMHFERERSSAGGAPNYTPADAAKIGIPDSAIIRAAIADRNDADIEALYGTVP